MPDTTNAESKLNKSQDKKSDNNANVLASIKERRKLLWGDDSSKTEEKSKNDWTKSHFSNPQDKKKFLKLLGMKSVDKVC